MANLQVNAPFPYHAVIESRAGRDYLLSLQITFVCVDTSTGPQSVNLATVNGPQIVIKDVSGNAGTNPITVIGTVDGVVNPTISTNYGVLTIFAYNGAWQTWIVFGGGGGSGDVVGPASATDTDIVVFDGTTGKLIKDGGTTIAALIAAAGLNQLTGDVTAGPGSGSQVATLANTAVTPSTYGDGTHVGVFTVDAKGRITAASNMAITAGGTGTVTNTGTLTANKAIIGNGGVDVTVSAATGVAHLSSGTLTGSNVDLTSEVTGDLPFANIAQIAALSALGNATNSTADIAATALSDGQSLKRVGTALTSARFGPASISLLTSGTGATYTVPAGIYRVRVRVQGPGGGGGGGDGDTAKVGVGGGGSAGGYAEKFISTTPGQTFTYTIGTGGSGGAAGNHAGSDGSAATVFDSGGSPVTGNAGKGGSSQAAGTTQSTVSGGLGVTATGGDVNITSAEAQFGTRLSGTTMIGGGRGSDSLLGFGGWGAFGAFGGNPATGYGSGGGGASGAGTGGDFAGGNGAPGVIIVEEYN